MGQVIDVDSHVYEPAAVWDEYVPTAERDRAKRAFHHVIDADGQATTILKGGGRRSSTGHRSSARPSGGRA